MAMRSAMPRARAFVLAISVVLVTFTAGCFYTCQRGSGMRRAGACTTQWGLGRPVNAVWRSGNRFCRSVCSSDLIQGSTWSPETIQPFEARELARAATLL
jgi:hypothetical protein